MEEQRRPRAHRDRPADEERDLARAPRRGEPDEPGCCGNPEHDRRGRRARSGGDERARPVHEAPPPPVGPASPAPGAAKSAIPPRLSSSISGHAQRAKTIAARTRDAALTSPAGAPPSWHAVTPAHAPIDRITGGSNADAAWSARGHACAAKTTTCTTLASPRASAAPTAPR